MDRWISVHEEQCKFIIPMLLFDAFAMYTWMRSTVVCPRQAQRAVGAGWAQAVEPIDLIDTGSPTHTWV